MKKCILIMGLLFLLSSCGRDADFVVDLREETRLHDFAETEGIFVIINKNSMTFHRDEHCAYLSRMKEENRMELSVKSEEYLLSRGYRACKRCAEEKDSSKNILP